MRTISNRHCFAYVFRTSTTAFVLEDVDGHASTPSSEHKPMLTNSGLLNALDGPTETVRRLQCVTTSDYGKLHPAVIRGGRIDRRVKFKNPLTKYNMRCNVFADKILRTGHPQCTCRTTV